MKNFKSIIIIFFFSLVVNCADASRYLRIGYIEGTEVILEFQYDIVIIPNNEIIIVKSNENRYEIMVDDISSIKLLDEIPDTPTQIRVFNTYKFRNRSGVYTLDGRLIKNKKQGIIYIHVYNDGTTKKILNKNY